MTPRFVALREDGLGGRMCALLNAIVLANETNGSFEFAWPHNPNQWESQAVPPADKIFSDEFLTNHHRDGWLDLFDPNSPESRRADHFQRHRLTNEQIVQICSSGEDDRACAITALQDLRFLIGRDTANAGYKSAIARIGFTDAIKRAIHLADQVDLGTRVTAVHLRGGDVVFRHRFNNLHTRLVLPFPLVQELARRKKDAGEQVLIFGQDTSVIDHVTSETNATSVSQLIAEHGLDGLEAWFFETKLMGRCQTVFAGKSAFAAFGSWIGGSIVKDGYDQFTPEEAYDLACKTIQSAAVPDLFKANAYWAIQDRFAERLTPRERIECISRSSIHDPENCFYNLAVVDQLVSSDDTFEAKRRLDDIVEAELENPGWRRGCLRMVLAGLKASPHIPGHNYLSFLDVLAEREGAKKPQKYSRSVYRTGLSTLPFLLDILN